MDGLGSHSPSFQDERLLAASRPLPVNFAQVAPLEANSAIGPVREEGRRLMQAEPALEIDAGVIHDLDGTGLRWRLVQRLTTVRLAVRDVHEGQAASPEVHRTMEFPGCTGELEAGPWEIRWTRNDGRGVEGTPEVKIQVLVFVTGTAVGAASWNGGFDAYRLVVIPLLEEWSHRSALSMSAGEVTERIEPKIERLR